MEEEIFILRYLLTVILSPLNQVVTSLVVLNVEGNEYHGVLKRAQVCPKVHKIRKLHAMPHFCHSLVDNSFLK